MGIETLRLLVSKSINWVSINADIENTIKKLKLSGIPEYKATGENNTP